MFQRKLQRPKTFSSSETAAFGRNDLIWHKNGGSGLNKAVDMKRNNLTTLFFRVKCSGLETFACASWHKEGDLRAECRRRWTALRSCRGTRRRRRRDAGAPAAQRAPATPPNRNSPPAAPSSLRTHSHSHAHLQSQKDRPSSRAVLGVVSLQSLQVWL